MYDTPQITQSTITSKTTLAFLVKQAMDFISSLAILILIIIFSVSYYYYFLRLPTTTKPPPLAGGARPFTGHLHLFNDPNKLPHIHLASLADQHGPIFMVRLGTRRLLMVNNWEIAKELFTTHDLNISSRPILRAAYHLGYDLAMFGWTPYGTYWRGIRKLIAAQLLSNRRVDMLRHVRASETTRYIKDLYDTWKLNKDDDGRMLVDMSQWFGDLNLNVVLRMVAGKRFYDDGADAEEGQRTRKVMREFFHLSGLFIPADVFPFLKPFDIGGFEKKMKKNAEELDRIVGLWLEEHKAKERKTSDKPQDFMDVMLQELRDDKTLNGIDIDTAIKANCSNLISGGTDTTSLILVWTLANLMNNPDVLKKAQEELDAVVGRERRVEESDINKLVYLQAIGKEAFRLHPAGHLGGPRAFTQDATVGGYHIPKGTWLMVNLWKLHRDPDVWSDDAFQFRPERFLDTHKEMDVMGTDYELLPFGSGRRICPGTRLGVHILHLVMANLLQAFDLWTVSDEPVDMAETAGMSNAKVTPLQVLVAPRLAPHLY